MVFPSSGGAGWDETYGYDVLGNPTACATSGPVDDDAPGPGDRTYSGTVIERAGRTFYRHDGQGQVVRRVTELLSEGRREWRCRGERRGSAHRRRSSDLLIQ